MGMFDYVRCDYPLPIEGANKLEYQSKDTPSQFMDLYIISEDGTLLHENYDIEDRSIGGKWLSEHPGEEIPENLTKHPWELFMGAATRVNKRIEPCDYTGALWLLGGGEDGVELIEWIALFDHGKLIKIELVRQEK